MSAREWKPGDVAMVRTRGHGEVVGIRTSEPATREFFHIYGFSVVNDGQVRPLVVIDPEDRDQVERLRDLMDDAWEEHGNGDFDGTRGQRGNALQAALRSLIPPPKPEEPTGLGAVVEDARGHRWVRVDAWGATETEKHNWVDHSSCEIRWPDIDAVKVLSEGVTP